MRLKTSNWFQFRWQTMNKPIIAAIVAAALLILPALASAASKLPGDAENLSAPAILAIYNGKTWQWGEGGAYFHPDRTFVAVTAAGKKLSYAEGRWAITTAGDVCFIADWHVNKSVYRNKKTCFSHTASAGKIYQREKPDGEWFVFKNKPAKPGDAINKLKQGNLIVKQFTEAKKKLGPRP